MTRVLFLDLETTGLSPERDLIWQVAYVRAYEREDTLTVVDAVEFVGRECVENRIVKAALEWANLLVGHNIAFEKKFC